MTTSLPAILQNLGISHTESESITTTLLEHFGCNNHTNLKQIPTTYNINQFKLEMQNKGIIKAKLTLNIIFEALTIYAAEPEPSPATQTTPLTSKKSWFMPFCNTECAHPITQISIEHYEIDTIQFSTINMQGGGGGSGGNSMDEILLYGISDSEHGSNIHVWSFPSCKFITTLNKDDVRTRTQSYYCLCADPSPNHFLACGGFGGHVTIWNGQSPWNFHRELINRGRRNIWSIQFNVTGDILATGDRIGTILIGSTKEDWPILFNVDAHKENIHALKFFSTTNNNEFLLSGGDVDGAICVINPTNGKIEVCLTNHADVAVDKNNNNNNATNVRGMGISSSLQMLLTGSNNGTIIKWSINEGGNNNNNTNILTMIEQFDSQLESLHKLDVHDTIMAVSNAKIGGNVHIYTLVPTITLISTLYNTDGNANPGVVGGVCFHPSGIWLLATSYTIQVWKQ
jgi:WD40 repeat protein